MAAAAAAPILPGSTPTINFPQLCQFLTRKVASVNNIKTETKTRRPDARLTPPGGVRTGYTRDCGDSTVTQVSNCNF